MAPHNIRETTKRTQVSDVLHQNDIHRRHLPRNCKPTKRLHSPKPTHTRKVEGLTIGSTRQTGMACKYEDPSHPLSQPRPIQHDTIRFGLHAHARTSQAVTHSSPANPSMLNFGVLRSRAT
eukprot:TRINITY_DN6553_c0_g1_i7.p1 TRINITY_DN6553_c0_g1~~TRINITY_DN6553_c0_g1_i7.p1  ORF type:complete len:121 (-),score=6.51 TRINITY_DN6553_c0_g1_i7:29-391(-)